MSGTAGSTGLPNVGPDHSVGGTFPPLGTERQFSRDPEVADVGASSVEVIELFALSPETA
jgi:hypothetical protein